MNRNPLETDVMNRWRPVSRRSGRGPGRPWRRGSSAVRRGAATAELAVGLIPLLVIFIGVIDTCQAMFLKEDLTTIAFESARYGARPSVTTAQISERAKQMCEERGVKSPTITISINKPNLAYDEVEVTIMAPEENNLTFDMINVDRTFKVTRKTVREQFNYE